MKNYWNFTLFSIIKAGEYFTLNTKRKNNHLNIFCRLSVDSQKITSCDSSFEGILNCTNDMAYILRVQITNQGLNDSSYQRILEFNMGNNIKLHKAIFKNNITSSDVMKDLGYIQPAMMFYMGGSVFKKLDHYN